MSDATPAGRNDQSGSRPRPRYTTRLLTTPEAIEAVAQDCIRCRANQKRASIDIGPDLAPPANTRSRVVVLCRDAEIVGFAWVTVRTWRYGWRLRLPGRTFTVARWPLRCAEYLECDLVAPDESDAQRVLAGALIAACADCHVVWLKYVAEDSELGRITRGARSKRGGRVVLYSWAPTPHWQLRIAGSFEDYLRRFSANTRTKFRRRPRVLGEACGGEVALRTVTDREQVRDFLAQSVRIAANTAWAESLVRDLGSELAADDLGRLADRGVLRSYLLTAGDELVAFQVGWLINDTYRMYRTGFDSRWDKCSPGTCLSYLVIQDIHRLPNVKVIDFGHGHWDYKQYFATDAYVEFGAYLIRPHVLSLIAFAPAMAGRAARFAVSALRSRGNSGAGGSAEFRQGIQAAPSAHLARSEHTEPPPDHG